MKKNIWSVVTIQEEDGHEFDGIFITNSEKALEKFARALSPLKVCCSYGHGIYQVLSSAEKGRSNLPS